MSTARSMACRLRVKRGADEVPIEYWLGSRLIECRSKMFTPKKGSVHLYSFYMFHWQGTEQFSLILSQITSSRLFHKLIRPYVTFLCWAGGKKHLKWIVLPTLMRDKRSPAVYVKETTLKLQRRNKSRANKIEMTSLMIREFKQTNTTTATRTSPTKSLMRRTTAVHVRYNDMKWLSSTLSTERGRWWLIFLYCHLEFSAVVAYLAWARF